MKSVLCLFFALLITACQPAARPHPVITAHVDAFNIGDIKAMSALEHPDIEWLSVNGSSVSVEVSGRDALATIMADYMLENPSMIGTLRDWSHNGDYTSVTETATWETVTGETQSQSALTVYQLEDNLIRRVWYYPAVNP